MDEPKNFAFQSIAAAYALNWVPHGYYFARMMVASKGQATNVTPRTNLDTLKSRLPAETWKALACARGAHLNTLEGFPLFAACMVCPISSPKHLLERLDVLRYEIRLRATLRESLQTSSTI